MMSRTISAILLAGLLAGCSGQYIVTIPDAVTAGDQPARVVTRLQRQEVWVVRPPIKDAVVQVGLANGPAKAAYTDKNGYAQVVAYPPVQAGVYPLVLTHQDSIGDEGFGRGSCYVLDADRLAIAVDFEAIEDAEDAQRAGEALQQLRAGGVQILYASEDLAGSPETAHAWLSEHSLPDGAVVGWARQRDWLGRGGALIGSLPAAREQIPSLVLAVYVEDDFCRVAEELNMIALPADDWAELARRILADENLIAQKDFAEFNIEQAVKTTDAPGE